MAEHRRRTIALPGRILVKLALSALAVFLVVPGCGLTARNDLVMCSYNPMPVASTGLDLLAFVSTKGQVYVWSGTETRLVYTPAPGLAVAHMAISPDPSRPYLALTEGPRIPDSEAIAAETVTVINVRTAASYRAFPLAKGEGVPERYAEPQDVYTLKWSADGSELFINGAVPLVMAIGDNTSTVAWDLGAIRVPDAEPRQLLLAPDFSRAAYSLFYLSADIAEDLWVLERPESAGGSSEPRRVTDGNHGGYAVCWIGSKTDGSEPNGEPARVLVQLGGISTGGGTPTGLAAVDTRTGELDIWYPEGNLVHRLVLVDVVRGRALVSLFHSITGRDGRLFWRPLDGRSAEVIVSGLDDKLVAGASVDVGNGSALVLARQSNDDGRGPWEYWVIGSGGATRRLGAAEKDVEAYLVDGTVGGHALVVTVSTDKAGASQVKLWRVLVDAGKVEAIELRAGSGR